MKRILAISIASASIAIGAIPAVAEVDIKTHKLCIEARDYEGCVKTLKGSSATRSQKEIKSHDPGALKSRRWVEVIRYPMPGLRGITGGANYVDINSIKKTKNIVNFDSSTGLLDRNGVQIKAPLSARPYKINCAEQTFWNKYRNEWKSIDIQPPEFKKVISFACSKAYE